MAISGGTILKVVVSLAFPSSVVAQNVFWTLYTASGSDHSDNAVLNDLETWVEAIYAELLDLMHTNVSLDNMKVYQYDVSEDDFDEVGEEALVGVGTDAADYLPLGVAAVTNANTEDPDVQGRKFWGGFTEQENVSGGLTAAALVAVAAAVVEWVTPFTGASTGSGFNVGVWSPTKGTFNDFTGASFINADFGYQRRRKPGVGI